MSLFLHAGDKVVDFALYAFYEDSQQSGAITEGEIIYRKLVDTEYAYVNRKTWYVISDVLTHSRREM